MIKLFFEIAHIIMIVARCTTINKKKVQQGEGAGGGGGIWHVLRRKK